MTEGASVKADVDKLVQMAVEQFGFCGSTRPTPIPDVVTVLLYSITVDDYAPGVIGMPVGRLPVRLV